MKNKKIPEFISQEMGRKKRHVCENCKLTIIPKHKKECNQCIQLDLERQRPRAQLRPQPTGAPTIVLIASDGRQLARLV
jgi:hypothetical protein